MTDCDINVRLAQLEGRKIHLVEGTAGYKYWDNVPSYTEDLNAVKSLMSALAEEIQYKVAKEIYDQASEYAGEWVKFRCATVSDVVLVSFFTPAKDFCKAILKAIGEPVDG